MDNYQTGQLIIGSCLLFWQFNEDILAQITLGASNSQTSDCKCKFLIIFYCKYLIYQTWVIVWLRDIIQFLHHSVQNICTHYSLKELIWTLYFIYKGGSVSHMPLSPSVPLFVLSILMLVLRECYSIYVSKWFSCFRLAKLFVRTSIQWTIMGIENLPQTWNNEK